MTMIWSMLGSGGGPPFVECLLSVTHSFRRCVPTVSLNLPKALGSMCYYPHFPDEETEAHGNEECSQGQRAGRRQPLSCRVASLPWSFHCCPWAALKQRT